MSKGLVCDQCGALLVLNSRGESDTGEEACWLSVDTTFGHFDLCTRECAHALLDSPDFVEHMIKGAECIAEIVAIINDEAAGGTER